MKGFYQNYLKRIIDYFLSLILMSILLPLICLVSILVMIELGYPIIYKQKRPGLKEKIFTLYKFRSMRERKESNGSMLPDKYRLSQFGILLRSTSIDELPELINIVKGDLSFVGPRPLLTQYLPLYNTHQRKRHLVRPGLTGLAQICGRNTLSWNEKFYFDLVYLQKISFTFDLKIIIKTLKKVIKREGVSGKNTITMEVFSGDTDL